MKKLKLNVFLDIIGIYWSLCLLNNSMALGSSFNSVGFPGPILLIVSHFKIILNKLTLF